LRVSAEPPAKDEILPRRPAPPAPPPAPPVQGSLF